MDGEYRHFCLAIKYTVITQKNLRVGHIFGEISNIKLGKWGIFSIILAENEKEQVLEI